MNTKEKNISILLDKLDELYDKREQVENNIYQTFNDLMDNRDNENKYKEINKKHNELYSEFRLLTEQIDKIINTVFWDVPPIKSNGEIELRKVMGNNKNNRYYLQGDYSICLSGEKIIIGEVSYRGQYSTSYLGDVGYEINEEYRGNNYAYHALCMFSEFLKEQGIDDFWITAYKDNVASIKTIEKYGGIPLKKNDSGYTDNVALYKCYTRYINDNNLTK